jgi:hypothetical protein
MMPHTKPAPTWQEILRRLEIAGPPVPDEAAKTAEQRAREESMRRRRWLLGHPRLASAVALALASD